MDLYYVDYVAVNGHSWLHRLPAGTKLAALVVLVGLLVISHTLLLISTLLLGVLAVAASARLPLRLVLALTLYPVLFLTILFLSAGDLTFAALAVTTVRVLAMTASAVVVLLSTSYPAIFSTLGRVLPGFLVAALFFTYRAIFVMADSLADMHIALHLRGGVSWRHPLSSLQRLGMALGHALVHALDLSQRLGDSLAVRGFVNRIYSLGRRDGR